jgi:ribosomal-protein-serine acetyltransferase
MNEKGITELSPEVNLPDFTLTDGKVILRRQKPDWAESMHQAALASVPEVFPWLSWCHADYKLEEAQGWLGQMFEAWDKGLSYEMAIFDSSGQRFLGGVGINNLRPIHKMANLGYWVNTAEGGRGVASSAVKLIADFALGKLGFKRLEIVVALQNISSQRVAEKCGALHEGVQRNRLFLGGKSVDAVMYSLIPES